jgi:hypothetical protein
MKSKTKQNWQHEYIEIIFELVRNNKRVKLILVNYYC